MKPKLQSILSTLALLSWGGLFLYFYFSGRVNDLLHPMFRPYVPFAGIVLLVLAGAYWFLGRDETCCVGDECEHGAGLSGPGRVLAFLILVVPLFVAARFSPDEYSATAVVNRGFVQDASGLGSRRTVGTTSADPIIAQADSEESASTPLPSDDPNATPADSPQPDYLPRNAKGQILAEVVDLFFGVEDQVIRHDFEGKEIEIVGQWMPAKDHNPAGNRANLVRMFMMCCAADARPVAVMVEVPGNLDFPEMTWVKVQGKPTYPVEGGRRLVVVKASEVNKTEPPKESMLY